MTDKSTGESSRMWYKLTDGSWLPGLFLRLAGRPGVSPSPDIPVCTAVS